MSTSSAKKWKSGWGNMVAHPACITVHVTTTVTPSPSPWGEHRAIGLKEHAAREAEEVQRMVEFEAMFERVERKSGYVAWSEAEYAAIEAGKIKAMALVPQAAMPSNGDTSDSEKASSLYSNNDSQPGETNSARSTYGFDTNDTPPLSQSENISYPQFPEDHDHVATPPFPEATATSEDHPVRPFPRPLSTGSIQEAVSAQAIATRSMASYRFDTDKPPLPLPYTGSPENVSYLRPPAYLDHVAPENIPMDCGMLPSYLYPPDQKLPGRRISSPREPELVGGGSGDSWTQVSWAVPFSAEPRPNDAYQRNPGECFDEVCNITHGLKTFEASPYIPPSGSSSGCNSRLAQPPANPHCTTASSTRFPPLREDQLFHVHGWVEYPLPDESLYYVHKGYQAVADMDLSDEKLLNSVMAYLQDHGDIILSEQELWLRDIGPRESGFIPLRQLVDHLKQSVTFDPLHEPNGNCEGHRPQHGCGDDRLDARYRYWCFMEAHPAHTSLPLGAHQDAINALNWASTNGLLPSHHSTPAPFTRGECQSLAALLQSIDPRGDTPLRTLIVSKILLRVVRWRQPRSRPGKPLPVDVDRDGPPWEVHPVPARGSAFMLTIMVYTCLAVVILVCPSQNFVRVAGVGAIFFALSPIVSNMMSTVRSKVDNRSILVPHVLGKSQEMPQEMILQSHS